MTAQPDSWPIRRYPWCALCGQVAVLRTGDPCLRCLGTLHALVEPDTRTPPPPAAPPLLRFLRWLGGTN